MNQKFSVYLMPDSHRLWINNGLILFSGWLDFNVSVVEKWSHKPINSHKMAECSRQNENVKDGVIEFHSF